MVPGVERVAATLERVLPIAALAGRIAVRGAVVAAVAAAVLVYALFDDGLPEAGGEAVARIVVALALFLPAVVLVLFWRACVEVVELPARLRALPGTAAGHAAELGRLRRERHMRRSRRAWRLLVLTGSARDLLTPHAPLVALLSPPFLLAAAASLAATALEALAALVVLLERL
jgi:hypothetical protein